MFSVSDLLTYRPLMRPIETVKTGIPNVLPPEFFSVKEDVLGHQAEVVELPGTRRVARVAPYGSPPKQIEHVPLSNRTITLLHTIEELGFRDELFRILRNWDQYVPMQARARDEIVRQGVAFVSRQDSLEVATLTSFLGNQGVAWFDGDGNILPSSSGAKLTVDQGIPANNKNQLNGIIAASWATATTNIVQHVTNVKNEAIQLTGYPLKYAFYGKNIPGYFAANDYIKTMWQFNQAYSNNWLTTGRMPPEMLELTWLPAYSAFFEDQTGTRQQLFPADGVTFTPEINLDTYTMYRGSYPVPTTFGPMADAEAALRSFTEVYGRFRYAYVKVNPSGIVDCMGNTFSPRFKVPAAYFCADVTP